jgi:phosphoserine phosphatase RsbU/P
VSSSAIRSSIAPTQSSGRLALVTVSGPTTETLELDPSQKRTYTVGRRPGQDLQLTDPASREHALFVCEQETAGLQWYLIDTNSKNGTQLNGVQLVPDRRYPIRAGDLIQVTHWTLRVSDPDSPAGEATIVRMMDDSVSTGGTISEIGSDSGANLARHRLALLMECAKSIHQAKDEQSLAKAVIEAAVVGTGFPNAAFLRPLGDDDSIDVVCARGVILSNVSRPQISRSLVRRAQTGKPCRMTRGGDSSSIHQSIEDLGIDEALCVPIQLSGMTTGFLYLDSRGESAYNAQRNEDAADFSVCIAQLAAMSMANLMLRDLERRETMIQAELIATGEAQRLIFPKRQAMVSGFEYIGENRPGRIVSGDFLDIIPLDDHRVAVTLGDVVGKGMAASVLMTVSVGFLRSALIRFGDPGNAVSALNEYLHPRCGSGRFITLWAAVVDREKREIIYTDAGHGYAFRLGDDGTRVQLNEGNGMPVGIIPESPYQSASIEFDRDHRLFVVSDGIIEQVSQKSKEGQDQFGHEAACEVICRPVVDGDQVEALFATLERHSGATQLDDDATALILRYG